MKQQDSTTMWYNFMQMQLQVAIFNSEVNHIVCWTLN